MCSFIHFSDKSQQIFKYRRAPSPGGSAGAACAAPERAPSASGHFRAASAGTCDDSPAAAGWISPRSCRTALAFLPPAWPDRGCSARRAAAAAPTQAAGTSCPRSRRGPAALSTSCRRHGTSLRPGAPARCPRQLRSRTGLGASVRREVGELARCGGSSRERRRRGVQPRPWRSTRTAGGVGAAGGLGCSPRRRRRVSHRGAPGRR